MFDDYDDIMTAGEVAEALKIGYNATYELLATGKIKSFRNGRYWRIPREALRDFLAENTGVAQGRKTSG